MCLIRVMRNRFTRSTLSNPDSSRSHLFVRISFKNIKNSGNKVFNMIVSDLAGAENPYEYLGEAEIEGYYIILSLAQLQKMMQTYSKYEEPKLDEINKIYFRKWMNWRMITANVRWDILTF